LHLGHRDGLGRQVVDAVGVGSNAVDVVLGQGSTVVGGGPDSTVVDVADAGAPNHYPNHCGCSDSSTTPNLLGRGVRCSTTSHGIGQH
jgi:hypothetical protein